jgi:hypothetical protein
MQLKNFQFSITKIQIKETTGGSIEFSTTEINFDVDSVVEFKQRLYDHCIALIDREVISQMSSEGVTRYIYNPDALKPDVSRMDEFILLYALSG